jgi:deazaflavin-dependent oxidoreductase (nitroreductase family)
VLLRLSRGRISVTLGQPMGLLTTIGAKSGQPRTTPLFYTVDEDTIILIASNGGQPRHPAWCYNLRANPEVTFLHGEPSEPMWRARSRAMSEKRCGARQRDAIPATTCISAAPEAAKSRSFCSRPQQPSSQTT